MVQTTSSTIRPRRTVAATHAEYVGAHAGRESSLDQGGVLFVFIDLVEPIGGVIGVMDEVRVVEVLAEDLTDAVDEFQVVLTHTEIAAELRDGLRRRRRARSPARR